MAEGFFDFVRETRFGDHRLRNAMARAATAEDALYLAFLHWRKTAPPTQWRPKFEELFGIKDWQDG
jgi:hypothetical protein